jgi:hypothetical protein
MVGARPSVAVVAGTTVRSMDTLERLAAKDAIGDVTEKRYAMAAIAFPFVVAMDQGIVNSDTIWVRTQRFTCPVACTVVRAFLDGNLTAAAAVTISLQRAVTAVLPSGATTPYLNVAAGATTATDVEDTNIQSVTLEAGVSYDLIIAGTSFNTDRFNVVLHVQVDRWRAFGTLDVPAFAFEDFADGLADATLVSGAIGQLTAAVAGLSVARGMSPAMVHHTQFSSATTAARLLRVLPVPVATRCASRIVRAYLTSSSRATGQVVTALLQNSAGATVATLSNNHAVDLIMTADSGVLSLTLNGGVELLTEDFTVQFSASTGIAVERASLLLWFEW